MKKFIVWFLLAIGGLFVLGCGLIIIGLVAGTDDATTTQSSTAVAIQTPTPMPEPIRITASELLAAYESNEVAAKAKYEDEVLEITGVVGSITESFGQNTMTLSDGAEFTFVSVRCTFKEEDVAGLLTIGKGQTVTVQGLGDGKGFIDVDVRDCRIVSVVAMTRAG